MGVVLMLHVYLILDHTRSIVLSSGGKGGGLNLNVLSLSLSENHIFSSLYIVNSVNKKRNKYS